MSAPIRVRRHTDGRVAIQVPAVRSAWSVVAGGGQDWVHECHVTGDGWSELFVAELPAPTGEEVTVLVASLRRLSDTSPHPVRGGVSR